jgi:hypothetical protein
MEQVITSLNNLMTESFIEQYRLVTFEEFDFSSLNEDLIARIAPIAVSHVLNAPVGLAKVTNYPNISSPTSVKIEWPECTAEVWAWFCYIIMQVVIANDPVAAESCKCVVRRGKMYPRCDDTKKTLVELFDKQWSAVNGEKMLKSAVVAEIEDKEEEKEEEEKA